MVVDDEDDRDYYYLMQVAARPLRSASLKYTRDKIRFPAPSIH